MVNRQKLALSTALAIAVSMSAAAQKKDDKKQSEDQKREIQAVVKLVDDVVAGQPAPDDLSASWEHEDFLKAQGNKEYVPFTVKFDASKLSAGPVAVYWRVVPKGGVAAPGAAEGKDKKDDKKNQGKRPEYPYEDITFTPVAPGQGQMFVSRSFTVPAGEYDVYVAVKAPSGKEKNAPPAKASVIKHSVAVPDFWNDELNTSSVIVAERIEPLPAPLTPQQQVERPYALGGLEIVPARDTKLSKKGELQTFMIIYNPKTDPMNKPDVTVEYNFYTRSGSGEKFFNKTAPQALNAQTLPPQFDVAAGHQLQAGQAVPLTSFPEGDYRLEIKVTDKIANKSLTRDVNFTVTGS